MANVNVNVGHIAFLGDFMRIHKVKATDVYMAQAARNCLLEGYDVHTVLDILFTYFDTTSIQVVRVMATLRGTKPAKYKPRITAADIVWLRSMGVQLG